VNVNGCADIISIGFNSLSESFAVGADLFTLNILGFNDGSGLVSSFETMERANNTANIIGNLTLVTTVTVPEPSTMAMFGIGLLALGFVARRRRTPAV
jgi:PEP-CTERM motif-containing protein